MAPGSSTTAGGGASAGGRASQAATHCLLLSGGLDSTTLAAWILEQHPGEPVKAFRVGRKQILAPTFASIATLAR